MLEKIGLPAKPALRGNNWVVDGSHCQGCSTQFTFINRKHHCRRCGGLFCNSCTQKRMVLRGQGDSPVRICEPCRKVEEAARFERRYGHKNRTGKGSLKVTDEDEVLNQILGSDRKELSSSGEGSDTELVRGFQKATSSRSASNIKEGTSDDMGEERPGIEEPNHGVVEGGSASPEEMRQQALDEKKKYRTLKAEGKSDEALKAFKRGKELERQASALELSLRKNRRKVLSSSTMPDILESNDENAHSGRKGKIPQKGKEKDDLAAELKELGWSDMDLRDTEKKPATTTLEGELSSLIGEVSQKSNAASGNSVIDKTQVIAHKRKALALKREGKLAEAKEELKIAKALEKKLEEEEFLADADDSDDELSALIRSMDNDKHDNLFAKEPSVGFGSDNLIDFTDDLGADGNVDVTDQDMEDPEIAAALQSFGWADDAKHYEDVEPQSASIDRDALSSEIQCLKREALNQKRAGNSVEAIELLRKAKLLEKNLEDHATNSIPHVTENLEKGSAVQLASNPKVAPKSRLAIQRELLGLKKRALALRREGKTDEADEELKKGKLLEQQLEEIDNASKVEIPRVNASKSRTTDATVPDLADEGDADVTDQDMHDPAYLALLSNLGWKEEDDKPPSVSVEANNSSVTPVASTVNTRVTRRSKGEIQKELLGLKRKALALRRQGETDEADELLEKAKVLETQLAEMEAPKREDESDTKRIKTDTTGGPHGGHTVETVSVVLSDEDTHDPALLSVLENLGWKDEVEPATRQEKASPQTVSLSGQQEHIEKTTHDKKEDPRDNKPHSEISQKDESSIRQEILLLKRKALALKREGKLPEAREELRQAKLLEKRLEDENASSPSTTNYTEVSSPDPGSTVPAVQKEQTSPTLPPKPMSGRDRFKLQQESLGHKRLALKLRREGRTDEADAEFELAKALEAQLEAANSDTSGSSSKAVDEVDVEDFLDPQLMSALRAIGIEHTSSVTQVAEKPEPVKSVAAAKQASSGQEIKELQEQIKAERVKAVNFKRSGKQSEALGALRRAKALEKKLNSLAS